ncbi:MmgE/PrpD family protein [Viridibacillus sp. NPDC093762]|uniref:MmgE/PrpD family protein n=1 Tax=Viridibacillus sp. NPDC093762 TaxID=3390720 RepID=UPI003D06613B
MGFSNQIANYIVGLTYEQLPKEVVTFTKRCILDYYASALKGRDGVPIQMINELIREMGGTPQATTVTNVKNSVLNVALLNGAASHIIELDDIHKASIVHAATVVMPAAIAVAEWKRHSGKDLITAIVAGYEVAYRVGETVSPSHYYYFHNTATCGTFGATAAVAKLLKLNENQIVDALGSAGTQAAGLWEFIEDGAMSKQLHPGKAAMHGVLSCLLAQKGFTGAKKILEGSRGFFEAMSEQHDVSKMTDGLGDSFKIIENSFKIHASCRHTHHVMDLLVEYHKGHNVNLKAIKKIVISTYKVALDITDNPSPDTIYAAKFSIQFCAALALITGSGSYHAFTEQILHDPTIRAIVEKIVVQVDEKVDAAYPEEWGTNLSIHFNDGSIYKAKTSYPVGDPENPVSTDALVEKFMTLTNNLPFEQRVQIVKTILNLEQYTVKELVATVHRKIEAIT